jgi:hypothetical protein
LKKTMLENLGQRGHQRWYDVESMESRKWLEANRRSIVTAVESCRDVDRLKRIAEIVEHDLSERERK